MQLSGVVVPWTECRPDTRCSLVFQWNLWYVLQYVFETRRSCSSFVIAFPLLLILILGEALKDVSSYGGMVASYLHNIFMTSYIFGTYSRIPFETGEDVYMLLWLISLRTFSLTLGHLPITWIVIVCPTVAHWKHTPWRSSVYQFYSVPRAQDQSVIKEDFTNLAPMWLEQELGDPQSSCPFSTVT